MIFLQEGNLKALSWKCVFLCGLSEESELKMIDEYLEWCPAHHSRWGQENPA